MVTLTLPALAVGAVVAVVLLYGSYRKGKADGIANGVEQAQREASREAHERATEREPPVSLGERVALGVKEFKTHHSGERVAVCKQEGFVVFVEGVPESVDVGDVVEGEVVSFGPDRNSAEAAYVGTA